MSNGKVSDIRLEYKSYFLIPVPGLPEYAKFFDRLRISYAIDENNKYITAELVDVWLVRAKFGDGQSLINSLWAQQSSDEKKSKSNPDHKGLYKLSIHSMQDLIDKLNQPKFDTKPRKNIVNIVKNKLPEYRRNVKSGVYFTGIHHLQLHELSNLQRKSVIEYLVSTR